MTRAEFVNITAYITAAIDKPLTPDRAEVYYDLLGDISADIFQLAAKQVVLNHKWNTFPSAAELREACTDIASGGRLSSADAWAIAWGVTGRIDPEIPHTMEVLNHVHPLIRKAMETFGINPLCYGKEPVGVARAQFMKIYEQLAEAENRRKLLPPALWAAISKVAEATKIEGEPEHKLAPGWREKLLAKDVGLKIKEV